MCLVSNDIRSGFTLRLSVGSSTLEHMFDKFSQALALMGEAFEDAQTGATYLACVDLRGEVDTRQVGGTGLGVLEGLTHEGECLRELVEHVFECTRTNRQPQRESAANIVGNQAHSLSHGEGFWVLCHPESFALS